jgi:hypothetical protein
MREKKEFFFYHPAYGEDSCFLTGKAYTLNSAETSLSIHSLDSWAFSWGKVTENKVPSTGKSCFKVTGFQGDWFEEAVLFALIWPLAPYPYPPTFFEGLSLP